MIKKFMLPVLGIITAVSIIGCVTSKDLQPGGPYNGDAYLYNIDSLIVGSYTTIDAFLIFEYQNNAFIKTNCPDVFATANTIREKTPTVLKTVGAARRLYIATLGNTNETQAAVALASNSLQNAVSELNSVATTASTAASQTPIVSNFNTTLVIVTNVINNVTNVPTN